MSGDYSDNEDGYITSPDINLSAYAGQPLILSWWQWLETEASFDFASVEISNDGGTNWTQVYGEVSGPIDTVWTEHSVTLNSHDAVNTFRIRFHLQSDYIFNYPGY